MTCVPPVLSSGETNAQPRGQTSPGLPGRQPTVWHGGECVEQHRAVRLLAAPHTPKFLGGGRAKQRPNREAMATERLNVKDIWVASHRADIRQAIAREAKLLRHDQRPPPEFPPRHFAIARQKGWQQSCDGDQAKENLMRAQRARFIETRKFSILNPKNGQQLKFLHPRGFLTGRDTNLSSASMSPGPPRDRARNH